MQTYSVLVADDEPLALSLVEKYVKQIPFLQLIGSHSNALSVLEQLEEEWVDILILDIQMPNLSGMQLAQQLAGQGHKIIFTTALSSMPFRAIRSMLSIICSSPLPLKSCSRRPKRPNSNCRRLR